LWAGLLTIGGVWAVTVVTPGPNFMAPARAALAAAKR